MTSELPADYREILRAELHSRCQVNPRYSLRAFARDIGLAPARLSLVLQGKQGLSRATAAPIAVKLGYERGECDFFCDLVSASDARSRAERAAALKRLQKRAVSGGQHAIKLETFRLIADWYHLAILGLTEVDGFQSSAEWIAQALAISTEEARVAIERLLKLGLLEHTAAGLRAVKSRTITGGHDIPSDYVKRFHQQVLQRAVSALHNQSTKEREIQSRFLVCDAAKIAEAKRRLDAFGDEFADEIQRGVAKDALYCFSFQFFNMTGVSHEQQ